MSAERETGHDSYHKPSSLVIAGFVFAAGYRIVDIDSYLMTIALGLAVCIAGGLAWCQERLGPRRTAALAAALVALNTATHWRDCDERGKNETQRDEGQIGDDELDRTARVVKGECPHVRAVADHDPRVVL